MIESAFIKRFRNLAAKVYDAMADVWIEIWTKQQKENEQ